MFSCLLLCILGVACLPQIGCKNRRYWFFSWLSCGDRGTRDELDFFPVSGLLFLGVGLDYWAARALKIEK